MRATDEQMAALRYAAGGLLRKSPDSRLGADLLAVLDDLREHRERKCANCRFFDKGSCDNPRFSGFGPIYAVEVPHDWQCDDFQPKGAH